MGAIVHVGASSVGECNINEREEEMNDENIALLAVTEACCAALGKQVQPAFLADEIEELRKRLADAIETRAK